MSDLIATLPSILILVVVYLHGERESKRRYADRQAERDARKAAEWKP